ncbi:hypothetical protein IGI04_028619 [Brassica rapa subsp. trilocularis]|uniref:Uncharacterized protein n=1 Tax=Brassica rapa subsp. trilocularis TaxID=1813537 RepID=A0ABQ7L2F5_BRACM|nr:hypothetical protein IGI04_028619 [Brassica rapa subsp. trilocularis]
MFSNQVLNPCFTLSSLNRYLMCYRKSSVLAKEATAIAIWAMTQNVDCCKHWDSLYKENLEASVALLKRLVEEWKEHSLKLSESPSNTAALNRTMKSFRLKNEEAITEGKGNGSLYKEADKSCKVISGRLSRGSGCLNHYCVVLAAAAAFLSSNPEATVRAEEPGGLIGAAPIL